MTINPLARPEDRRFYVSVIGNGFYVTGYLPELPRKGDVLWLRSLCKYDDTLPQDALVTRVEWTLNQAENLLHYRITVRRIQPKMGGR